MNGLIANNYRRLAADRFWDEMAVSMGYKDQRNMLYMLYRVKGLSLSRIGKKLGFTDHTIRLRLERFGIPRRKRGGPNNTSTIKWREIAKDNGFKSEFEMLFTWYVVIGMSTVEIGKKLSRHQTCICRHIRKLNIRKK